MVLAAVTVPELKEVNTRTQKKRQLFLVSFHYTKTTAFSLSPLSPPAEKVLVKKGESV